LGKDVSADAIDAERPPGSKSGGGGDSTSGDAQEAADNGLCT
jgi:hypothetical protein